MEKQFTHIICDPDKCVCCGDCEMACSMTKHQVFDPSLARIRTIRVEPVVLLAVGCRACADAPCVVACPRNALTQDPEKGIILVDQEMCDGCGWCIEACDFGAILLNPATKRVEICDHCIDEEEPQCVKFCKKDALMLAAPETASQKVRKEAVSKLLQDLVAGK